MRVVAITHVFPHSRAPLQAPFNRLQLAALGRLCDLEVWGTIPWFPGAARLRGGGGGDIPAREVIDGLDVHHPRTPYVPGGARVLAAPLYAAALARRVGRLRGRVDALLACWAYPDAAAAVWLGRIARAPVVVKVHGSDLNVVAERRGPRALLRVTLPAADAVVAVSRPLAERAIDLGAPRRRVAVVYNGVDRRRFTPRDRREARRRLGLAEDARWILYCGHLKRSKGVEDLLEAFSRAASGGDARLAIVGDGPARGACERAAAGAAGRIHLAGARPHAEIPDWMTACDVLALPSWSEGTPNVALEALASGRPVVATDAGGTADVVSSPELGEIVPTRDPPALAAALGRALASPWDPEAIARAGRSGDWDESARELYRVIESARESAARGAGARGRGSEPKRDGRAGADCPRRSDGGSEQVW